MSLNTGDILAAVTRVNGGVDGGSGEAKSGQRKCESSTSQIRHAIPKQVTRRYILYAIKELIILFPTDPLR